MRPFLTVLLLALLALPVVGCSTMEALGNDLAPVTPVSQADVDRVRADHDAAIQAVGAAAAAAAQQLRADMDAADARIRADAQAADQAQAAAISRAAEEGKTWTEAALAGLTARTEAAAIDAQAAKTAAAQAEAKAKAHADARAGDLARTLGKAAADAKAAREESEGGLPWWGVLLLGVAGLFPASWGVKRIAVGVVIPLIRTAIAAFDKQPFEGPNGEQVTEEQLVARLVPPPPGAPAAAPAPAPHP